MKNVKCILLFISLATIFINCKKVIYDDISFVNNVSVPSKLSAMFDITQDNTGVVTITPNGEGVTTFDIFFGDATSNPVTVNPGANSKHTYAEGVYNVKIVGHGINGKTAEATQQLTVSFRAPENLQVTAAIDAANSFKVNVSAKALYETNFKIFFGDDPNEVPQTFLEGQTISHTYINIGTYTITVIAQSGGAATTKFTQQIIIVDPVLLPITFESSTVVYKFNNFGGGNVTVINNPHPDGINTSFKVGQMIKKNGETYGGSAITLSKPIDFTANKIFRMKVYSPRVGARVLLKVEDAGNPNNFYQVETPTTLMNTWEDMVFDFTAINTTKSYKNIVLIFDNGIKGDGTANYTFLFDDIRLTNSLPNGYNQIDLPVTFDDPTVNYTVTDFGNAQTLDGIDPTNPNNKIKITTKVAGAQTWAGTTIGTPSGFKKPIPLTATSTQMSIRVYSAYPGTHVRLKVEDHNNSNISVETEAITSQTNTWETLTFDFKNPAPGTPDFNSTKTYDKASVFFDFNNAGTGKVFYWDDVLFVSSIATLSLPLDFESSTLSYNFTNFNGGNVTVIPNPQKNGINTSNKVAKMVKNAGEVYGGSFIKLDQPIDFSTKKTFTVKVFSPRIGAKLLLKVENLTNGSISFEKEVATKTANTWETLIFDYSTINTANSYQKIVFIFDLGTVGDGSANFTYLFDDVSLN